MRAAKNSLRILPPKPNENQDINNAITRAFFLAGEIWLNDVSNHANALGKTEEKINFASACVSFHMKWKPLKTVHFAS